MVRWTIAEVLWTCPQGEDDRQDRGRPRLQHQPLCGLPPPKMCEFLALHFFKAWEEHVFATYGRGFSLPKSPKPVEPQTSSSSLPVEQTIDDPGADGLGDIALHDMRFGNEMISQEAMTKATAEADARGVDGHQRRD